MNESLNSILNPDLKTELNDAILSCSKGDSYDFFKFGAAHVATLNKNHIEQSLSSDCFENTKMTYHKIDNSSVQIEIDAQNPTFDLCSVFKYLIIFLI